MWIFVLAWLHPKPWIDVDYTIRSIIKGRRISKAKILKFCIWRFSKILDIMKWRLYFYFNISAFIFCEWHKFYCKNYIFSVFRTHFYHNALAFSKETWNVVTCTCMLSRDASIDCKVNGLRLRGFGVRVFEVIKL